VLIAPDTAKTAAAVSFSLRNLPPNSPGADHWIALTEASLPDTKYGNWAYIPRTVSAYDGSLTTPGTPGSYELRLYLNWPPGDYVVVARKAVTITPLPTPSPPPTTLPPPPPPTTPPPTSEPCAGPPSPGLSFPPPSVSAAPESVALTAPNTVSLGQCVPFQLSNLPPLLPNSAYHWITLVKASDSDVVYNDYHAIYGSVTTFHAQLKPPATPGQYELRLYLQWFQGAYTVALRRPVTIVP
jgi:hypothetical protein